jgi:hypothetical protein
LNPNVSIVTDQDASVLQKLEAIATKHIDQMLASHPFLLAFHAGTDTNPQLYRRHLLEAALRIRMNNAIDSFALAKTIQDDPIAERLLIYVHEEYGHDRMLEEDVQKMGLSAQELSETEPLFATELLMAYLWRSVDHDGMLPALVWDWLVEWYSPRYNPQITQAAATVVGSDSVRQAQRHLDLDQELEHEDVLTQALSAVIVRDDSLGKAERYLEHFVRLIEIYFHELLAEFGL